MKFSGAKLALIFNGKLLVYKRDEFDHIPFPGCWDFPGGGRENGETPEECVLRELEEEFAVSIPASRLDYKRRVASHDGKDSAFFFVATGLQTDIESIVFGEEGQFWQLMEVNEYLEHPQAVPALVSRFTQYLESSSSK